MKVYLTGSSGTIGRYLNFLEPLEIELRNPETFTKIPTGVHGTVIHLAGVVGAENVLRNERLSFQINVNGTVEFANVIKQKTNCRFIFVSTCHVYKPSTHPHLEDDPIEPINAYGWQKRMAEIQLQRLFADEPNRFTIARLFSILGPNMKKGTLGWNIERVNASNPIRNVEDVRDFTTPQLASTMLYKLSQVEFKFPSYNVCSGKGKTVRDAAEDLLNSLNIQINANYFISGN